MQKLLKAMPDVRRDYVRELDTALVESRIFPLKDVWSSIVSSRIVFQYVSTCFNMFQHVSTLSLLKEAIDRLCLILTPA